MENKESRTGNVIMNTIAGNLRTIVTSLVRFVIQTVFIYTLGKQYTGVAGLFTDILLVLSVTELGFGVSVQTFLYKPISEGDTGKISSVMRFQRNAYRAFAAFVLIVGLAITPFIDYFVTEVPDVKESLKVIFLMYIIKTATNYLFFSREVLLEAYQKKRVVYGVTCLVSVIALIPEVIILVLFKSFYAYLATEVAASIITNILVALYCKKNYAPLLDPNVPRLSSKERGTILRYVGSTAVYRVANVIVNNTDTIIISKFINTAQVAVLVTYRFVVNFIKELTSELINVALPGVGNIVAKEEPDKAYEVYGKLRFITFTLNVFTSACLISLLDPFVDFWVGPEYVFDGFVSEVLVLNYYVMMAMTVNQVFRFAFASYDTGRIWSVIMAVLNIVLSLAFVRPLGIFGVIAASVVSRLVTRFWYDPWVLHRKYFKRSISAYARKTAGEFLFTVFVWMIAIFCTEKLPNGLLWLFVKLVITCGVTMISYLAVFAGTKDFRETVVIVKIVFAKIQKSIGRKNQ